jgi:hypothetical protein
VAVSPTASLTASEISLISGFQLASQANAFQTLAANGKAIGISFEDHTQGRNQAEIDRAFDEFDFSEKTRAIFSANLKH